MSLAEPLLSSHQKVMDNQNVHLTSAEAQGTYGSMASSAQVGDQSSEEDNKGGIQGAYDEDDSSSDEEITAVGAVSGGFDPTALAGDLNVDMKDVRGSKVAKRFTPGPDLNEEQDEVKRSTTHNESAQIEGYCFVFAKRTKYHRTVIRGDKLAVERRTDLNDEEKEKAAEVEKQKHFKKRRRNILKHFKRIGLRFKIHTTEDNPYIFVIISMSHSLAEKFADYRDMDVNIDPRRAVEIGRESKGFILAHNTYLDGVDENETFVAKGLANHDPFHKIKLEEWEYIHVSYEAAINKQVYRRNEQNGHLLDNRLFLRILYDFITEDHSVESK